ncbi:MAG: hypothetical protein JW852_09540 [Spirochaetales bacterium]|nr:hypothetical protein [Spirochaetales bacterium]
MPQYTIRNIPEALDRELRERARQRGMSLNDATIEAIKRGLGIVESEIEYHDLDDLIGTWKKDTRFDQALEDQHTVDPSLWQ